jgi:hypothetical protein
LVVGLHHWWHEKEWPSPTPVPTPTVEERRHLNKVVVVVVASGWYRGRRRPLSFRFWVHAIVGHV